MTYGLYVTFSMVYKPSFLELFFKTHNALTFKKYILMKEGQFGLNY